MNQPVPLEMLMIKMREQTENKPKQAEALEAAIQALKEKLATLIPR